MYSCMRALMRGYLLFRPSQELFQASEKALIAMLAVLAPCMLYHLISLWSISDQDTAKGREMYWKAAKHPR